MKTRILSLALALAVCLGLMVPAEAATRGGAVTVYGMTISDYYVTDIYPYPAYEDYGEPSPEREYEYYLGEIPYGDGLWSFLLPMDATVTFNNSNYSITGLTLDELDASNPEWEWMGLEGAGTKLYAEGYVDYKDYTKDSGGAQWDYARFQEEFPGFDYLYCDNEDQFIRIMFVDEATLFAPNASTLSDSAPGTPAPSSGNTVGGFSDVKEGDFFAEPVLWAVDKGVTTGTGDGSTFSPENTCSVSEIITFLWRAKNAPAPTIANPYTDGSADGWFQDAAVWAYENGLTADGAFPAGEPCTRAMVVTYLWKLAGSPAASGSEFSDVSADAPYAQAVAWAVSEGITTGTGDGTAFSPDKTCTRGEIVTFLYRALAE